MTSQKNAKTFLTFENIILFCHYAQILIIIFMYIYSVPMKVEANSYPKGFYSSDYSM